MKRFREEGELASDCISLANVLMLLSRGGGVAADHTAAEHAGRVFECKTCNRQFPSFQALGGHRASHKKPRAMGDGPQEGREVPAAKPRVHECSICGLEFSVGQALGGHMRRHRAAAEGLPLPLLVEKKKAAGGSTTRRRPSGDLCLDLDLNLPPEDDDVDPPPHGLSISLRPPVACWLQ